MFNGKTHYKWQFSIAMLDYQRVYLPMYLCAHILPLCISNASHFPSIHDIIFLVDERSTVQTLLNCQDILEDGHQSIVRGV